MILTGSRGIDIPGCRFAERDVRYKSRGGAVQEPLPALECAAFCKVEGHFSHAPELTVSSARVSGTSLTDVYASQKHCRSTVGIGVSHPGAEARIHAPQKTAALEHFWRRGRALLVEIRACTAYSAGPPQSPHASIATLRFSTGFALRWIDSTYAYAKK